MKKLLLMLTAVAFLFAACEKDKQQTEAVQNATQDGATIEFKIEQTDFGYKNTVPMCNDELSMSYARFTIVDSLGVISTYNSLIYYVAGEMLTQVIKLPVGTYHVTSFTIYNDNGTPEDLNDDIIVRAAPLPNSEYWDLMTYQLDLEFTVDAFYKKQFAIDVLCYEELFYMEFGFTWFEFNDVRIERQCIFGDICVDDYADYANSSYEGQANGIQFDLPAIFEIHVFKGDDEEPLRTFSNAEWLGEGQCLEIYWPNRLDVEGEVFSFELWVLLPTLNGFEYVLMDTWTFLDGEGATTGEDGVVDFVIGDCQLYPADYMLDYTVPHYGDVSVTLTWDNTADLDLWVTDPSPEWIYYGNPVSVSGGQLDNDNTSGFGPETIAWPSMTAPPGDYFVQINHFSGEAPTNYTVEISFFGTDYTYTGSIDAGEVIDIVLLTGSKSANVLNYKHQLEIELPAK